LGAESFEETSEYGMLVGAVRREAGIWLTQVGNPLPHCHEGVLYCISLDRFPGAAGRLVPDGEDKKVAQLGFGVRDVAKARADAKRHAELCPEAEDGVPRTGSFDGVGPVGD